MTTNLNTAIARRLDLAVEAVTDSLRHFSVASLALESAGNPDARRVLAMVGDAEALVRRARETAETLRREVPQ